MSINEGLGIHSVCYLLAVLKGGKKNGTRLGSLEGNCGNDL